MQTTDGIVSKDELIDEIRVMIYAIYHSDTKLINQQLVDLIDMLSRYIDTKASKEGLVIELNSELLELEKAYESKDYILIADIIKGKIFPKII